MPNGAAGSPGEVLPDENVERVVSGEVFRTAPTAMTRSFRLLSFDL